MGAVGEIVKVSDFQNEYAAIRAAVWKVLIVPITRSQGKRERRGCGKSRPSVVYSGFTGPVETRVGAAGNVPEADRTAPGLNCRP